MSDIVVHLSGLFSMVLDIWVVKSAVFCVMFNFGVFSGF